VTDNQTLFLSIKFFEDQSNRDFIEQLTNKLSFLDLTVVCVVRDVEHWGQVALLETELMKLTFQMIDECQLFLVEASEKGVGIGIEAGYAYAKRKKIIVAIGDDKELSATLRGVASRIFTYRDIDDLVGQIRISGLK